VKERKKLRKGRKAIFANAYKKKFDVGFQILNIIGSQNTSITVKSLSIT